MGRGRGLGGKGRSLPARGCWRLTERAGAAGGGGDAAGRAGGQAWREERAQTRDADRRGDTHTRGLTAAGAYGVGGPRLALTWQRWRRRRPRPGRSPRAPGLPPGWRATGWPAGADRAEAEAAATPEPRTAGRRGRSCTNRLRAARLGPAALGGARLRSAPLGGGGGVARGPPPRSPLAPGGAGLSCGRKPPDVAERTLPWAHARASLPLFSARRLSPAGKEGGPGADAPSPEVPGFCTPCPGLSREPPKKGHARLHFQKDASWIGNPDPCPAALFSVQYFPTSIAWELVFLLSHKNFTAVFFLSSVS